MSTLQRGQDEMQPLSSRRVVIVGGGIAGLAAAHRLAELDPAIELTLLESTDRLGGILRTDSRGGFLVEQGADSFITTLPWGIDLCKRIGIESELIRTDGRLRRTYVVRRGKLLPVPRGFLLMSPSRLWPMLASSVLSVRGKSRLLAERFVPRRRGTSDESLASFARRRLGHEVYERLVQPLVAGIYSADPERLSLAATMPRFIEAERRHGSLIRAARRDGSTSEAADPDSSGARYSQFVAPRDGMERLVKAIVAKLPPAAIQLNRHVESLARHGHAWEVRVRGSNEPIRTDGVILSPSAPVAARLLAKVDADLSAQAAGIEHAGMAIVSLAYRQEQIARPVAGFGLVVPAIERRKIIAASISSNKFEGRAPARHVLVRVFIGGACQAELLDLSDAELEAIAMNELHDLLGASGTPVFAQVARWRDVMPQYHLGHLDRVESIQSRVAVLQNLALAGNAYEGVGIPQVIRSGEAAAETILRVGLAL